tara:strand:- start:40918 stop:41358 length:441 start_codon:yes stop_codon:yes gene_type:complete
MTDKSKDSQSKRMTVDDIVKNSIEVKRSGVDWKKFHAYVYAALKFPKYRLMRSRDTLFLYEITAPHELRLLTSFNAEKSNKTYFRNVLEFGAAMEKAGFYRLIAKGITMQLVRMLESKYPVQYSEIGQSDDGEALYAIEVDIRKNS